jgi:hypothetical protein
MQILQASPNLFILQQVSFTCYQLHEEFQTGELLKVTLTSNSCLFIIEMTGLRFAFRIRLNSSRPASSPPSPKYLSAQPCD